MITANNQQRAIVDAVNDGTRIVIGNALAGSGKTSTAEHIAREIAERGESMLYLVFNKANAEEAKSRFPSNTKAQTAHSFAYQSIHPDTVPAAPIKSPTAGFFGGLSQPYRSPPRGKTMGEVYKGRLVGSIYHALRDMRDIDVPTANAIGRVADTYGMGRKMDWVIQDTLRRFCQTGDDQFASKHIPSEFRYHIESHEKTPDYTPILKISQHLFDMMRDTGGKMPVDHGFYLKLCSMQPPRIGADIILLDEGQDANAAMLKIIDHQIQSGSQAVFMGDTYQHIYSFTGAVDSMRLMREKYGDQSKTLPLTQSYRFGPQIADAGNVFLKMMGSEYELEGLGNKHGSVRPSMKGLGQVTRLHRTNMSMLIDVIDSHKKGESVCIAGGGDQLKKLLIGVSDMFEKGRSSHPEIGKFENWAELAGYTKTKDGLGLKPVVNYVESRDGSVGEAVIALDASISPGDPSGAILTTAHKSKGLQWNNVELALDFQSLFAPTKNGYSLPDVDDLALMYVASTRARELLLTNGMIGAINQCLKNAAVQPTRSEVMAKAKATNMYQWEIAEALAKARKGDKPDISGALGVIERMRQPYQSCVNSETMSDIESIGVEQVSAEEAEKHDAQLNLFGTD